MVLATTITLSPKPILSLLCIQNSRYHARLNKLPICFARLNEAKVLTFWTTSSYKINLFSFFKEPVGFLGPHLLPLKENGEPADPDVEDWPLNGTGDVLKIIDVVAITYHTKTFVHEDEANWSENGDRVCLWCVLGGLDRCCSISKYVW